MNNMNNTSGRGNMAAAARALLARVPHGVALLGALSFVGCLAPTGDEADGDLGVTQQAALTHNALTHNALTHNALTHNALSSNALTGASLTSSSLTSNVATSAALADADSREVLEYVVSCALPAGKKVDVTVGGVAYSFPGSLGLAPQWEQPGGTCNASCQEWVSSCVIARLDYLGEYVPISLRGSMSVLAATPLETAAYSVAEGAYYGNIFLPTPVMYACVAPGQVGLSRVCGPTTTGCIVKAMGMCDDMCERVDSTQGFYSACRNAARGANGYFPSGTRGYAPVGTVFVTP